MGGDTLLDLILANEERLVRDERDGGSLGCSNHEIVKLRIWRGRKGANGRMATRHTFAHSGQIIGRIPWIGLEKKKWPKKAG